VGIGDFGTRAAGAAGLVIMNCTSLL
jgi:hypothetical protein